MNKSKEAFTTPSSKAKEVAEEILSQVEKSDIIKNIYINQQIVIDSKFTQKKDANSDYSPHHPILQRRCI